MRFLISAGTFALIAAWALPATAQWWNPGDRTPPKLWGTPEAPKVTYTRLTVDYAATAANAAFWNDDFAKLDRMYDEFLRDGVRATDGTWLVESIGRAIANLDSANEDLVKKAFARWAVQSPQSKLRPVAEAVLWQARAWAARGGGYASSVPGESARIFQERLARATQALKDAEPEGKQSPLWYWVALIVAGSSGQPAAQFDGLFREAVDRFPLYQPLYYTRMNYLLPQWGGSYKAVDAFIRQSVDRTAEKEGDSFYAWLYLDVVRKHDGDVFTDTLATWPAMKKAFEDMVARHPDAWNKNVFATFACRVRDQETTARLLGELGTNARLGAWSPGVTTESCKRFALIAS